MEEKIVIIGNGFDLRHFLPTKYNHLITILKVIENLNFENYSEVNFENLFGNFFRQKDEKFYKGINEFYETSKIIFNKKDLKSIQERIKTNSWFQYLKSVEDNKIENWIDFETEIERVLKMISKYFDNFNNNVFDSNFKIKNNKMISYHFFDKRFSSRFFDNNLQFNILRNFNLLELIKDNIYFRCNENFILEVEDQLQYFKEKDFFDSIYNSLEKFAGIFNDYIEKIINVFYKSFKEEKKENFICINNKFLFDKVNQIFSFNYTNTFNNLYNFKDIQKEKLRKISKNIDLDNPINFRGLDFLHGRSIQNWNGNLEKLKIVLGIDDIDSLLKKHKLFQFTKYFQKLHRETDYNFLKELYAENWKYKKSITFYFWGHSLDYSDREYIEVIFRYLIDDSRAILKIFYHSISTKADQLKNLLSIIDKNIIENMMKNKRLTFVETTPENLFAEL